jgi:hypothetical protein
MVQFMADKPDPAKRKRHMLALSVGLFLLAVYILIYRGGFHSVDEVAMYAVTESIAKFGNFNIDQIAWIQWTTTPAEAQGFFGTDGHIYSKKGLALSLAQMPLYWLALILPGLGMLQTVSLLNAIITAATGMLIFMFAHRLNYPTRTAVLTTLIFGLATIAMVYAKYLFSEPLAGFLLLLAAYMLFVYRQEGGWQHIAIAGLAAGFAVMTRANNLFTLPVYSLYLLWVIWQQGNEPANQRVGKQKMLAFIPPLVVFILSIGFAGVLLMAYNAFRAGNPTDTGYDLTLFSPNILLGLYKLLFSPLRGLFVYTPVLLLSLPGWWYLRKIHPAEAWLFAGIIGITVALFSAWSSGEGLSWGSRFLVPLIPFFALSMTPIVEKVQQRAAPYVLRFTFYALLLLSLIIQFLGIAINPWVFLGKIQADFGGEFFLENTAALYDFRYSQIAGQLESWSLQNSDVVWWQPWGFDWPAFGLSLGLVLFSGWLLWLQITTNHQPPTPPALLLTPYLMLLVTLLLSFFLLARYSRTDLQFGPPDDAYTRALNIAAAQRDPADQIATAAQYHYHVPMNRFKARVPITGFAQQTWPPPHTALPLLRNVTAGPNVWLVTVGFQPAAPNNATEQWLAANTFKTSDEWLGDSAPTGVGVRLVRYATQKPKTNRSINATLGQEMQLMDVNLVETIPAGQALPVEFTWRSRTQPRANYNLFLQLLNQDGTLIAQHDSPPNGGYTPTSTWLPGQPVTTRHALPLPTNLPPGDYRLITGLYHPNSGERLITESGNDFIELGIIHVER